jgi:hypothetical protein
MMGRFIIWMILVFIAAKILGQVIRSIRLLLTPNKDVLNRKSGQAYGKQKSIEDIPYEEIKEKQ